ncbi:MAG: hypothetical protein OJF52_003013 [Nitrospira sp.]|jgi:hypothetical protein|nr:MAG: hypothetical protein OJF52_003013 [Nitrospira sp.]
MAPQPNLNRECELFSEYLIDLRPSDYVLRKYQEAHHLGHPFAGRPVQLFDHILMRLALRHAFILRLADTYSGLFYKEALLRRKLVLLLAILECSPGAFDRLDRPELHAQPTLYRLLVIKGFALAATALLAVLLLAPIQVACKISRRWRDR